jgi:hypothetical protein
MTVCQRKIFTMHGFTTVKILSKSEHSHPSTKIAAQPRKTTDFVIDLDFNRNNDYYPAPDHTLPNT